MEKRLLDTDVLFDDWAVRRANALKRRKLDFVICAVPIAFLALFSMFVMVFITFSAIFFASIPTLSNTLTKCVPNIF